MKTENNENVASCMYELWNYMHREHGVLLLQSELGEICDIIERCRTAVSSIEQAAECGKPYICRGSDSKEDYRWAFTVEHEVQLRCKWAARIPWGYGQTIEKSAENFLEKMKSAPMDIKRRLNLANAKADL